MKSLRPGRHRAAVVLLVALLTLAFAVQGGQPSHNHADGLPGLYNTDCPLAALSAVHTAGWAPEPTTIASPESVALPIATSSEWVPSPFRSLAASRAPPLA